MVASAAARLIQRHGSLRPGVSSSMSFSIILGAAPAVGMDPLRLERTGSGMGIQNSLWLKSRLAVSIPTKKLLRRQERRPEISGRPPKMSIQIPINRRGQMLASAPQGVTQVLTSPA